MNEFRTTLKPGSSDTKIGLNHPVLTLGSCFADTMGHRLKRFKFDVLTNPFGVLFNPISIHNALEHALKNIPATEEGILQNQTLFYHYDFHSEHSATSADKLKANINSAISTSHDHLKKTKWLILTYGTSWVYTLKDSEKIVANCHKMPAQLFSKSLVSVKTILESFETVFQQLLKINPEINIILTVSPVRHLRDTLELNAVSKSVLRLACHHLSQQHPNILYFPAYELMVDDLRDYRFYQTDMIHPSTLAEDYIWNHFMDSFVDKKSHSFITTWSQILKDLEHKPFHPESEPHQQFLKNLIQRLTKLSEEVDVDNELQFVKNQLTNKMD